MGEVSLEWNDAETRQLLHLGSRLSSPERIELLHRTLAGGQFACALALCDDNSDTPIFQLLRAQALQALGRTDEAIGAATEQVQLNPDSPLALYALGEVLALGKLNTKAASVLRKLVEISPNYPGALALLARVQLPGPHYRDVLALAHRQLRPQTYLEIGVESGQSLRLASNSPWVVGVDPNPQLNLETLPPGVRVFPQTSDDFFNHNSASALEECGPIDLAFVDGMHRFENVLRDFCNVEKFCNDNSCVVLHDCLPVAPVAASRHRGTRFWVGDCWKALDILLETRPDLDIHVIPCPPSGLVVIRNLNPKARSLARALPQIISSELETTPPRSPRSNEPCEPGQWSDRYPLVANTGAAISRLFHPVSTEPAW